MGIEVFKKHLREKRAVKIIAGINNRNLDNVAKVCSTFTSCSGRSINDYKFLNNENNSSGITAANNKTVITSDGQMFAFVTLHITSFGTYGISESDSANRLVRILVDVNGPKNPNVIGYDTFIFYVINEKGIIPAGSSGYSDCKKGGSGSTCAARVLKENAINY